MDEIAQKQNSEEEKVEAEHCEIITNVGNV